MASNQPRDKIRDMIRTAADGAENSNLAGFPKLAETFGDAPAKLVAKWLGYDGDARRSDELRSEPFFRNDEIPPNLGEPCEPIWPEPQPCLMGYCRSCRLILASCRRQSGPGFFDIADRMQCPADFIGISAVVALGSGLGCKIAFARSNMMIGLLNQFLGDGCRMPWHTQKPRPMEETLAPAAAPGGESRRRPTPKQ